MKKSNPIVFENSSAWKQRIQIGFLALILASVVAVMVWNTSELNRVLERSTGQYVKDVSYQLTSDIAARVYSHELALQQLADSIPRLTDDEATEEFLERKAKILDFDDLVLISKEGDSIPKDFDITDLQDFSGIKQSFDGETALTYVEGQNLLYSTPVYSDGKIDTVLVGVRKKETMQALIQPKSFGGSGLSCIVGSEGEVVVSPTDLKPFLQLEDIIASGSDEQAVNAVEQMKEDMKNKASGVFYFTSVGGRRLVMSYHALGVNDWILLTLVPADLISGEANAYMYRSFAIVGGIVVIFTLFIFLTIRFYRKNRRELEKIAFTDPLTGGMNNAAFQMEFQKLTEDAPPSTYTVALMNVKGFKLINENFGILAGNDILKHIYFVLKNHVKKGELVARGEADYFFLALKENQKHLIQERLNAMEKDINAFDKYADIHYYLVMQQAAYIVDEPEIHAAIAQNRVRTAYRMRREEGKCSFYSWDLTEQMKKEQELNLSFDFALQNQEFQIYLQPKVYLQNGVVGGAEALVRWKHPKRGMISPAEFIPVFEKNGNICKLDLYVFEEVCKILNKWKETGKNIVPVSVNLSRVHFRNLNFLRDFADIKNKYKIPDGYLELEITESVFFNEEQRLLVKNAVDKMHTYGILCSLDDFGVGYSSLGLLKEFNVDTIKLDRQFFINIESSKTQNVIESFIGLAEKLGIGVVAEGIETTEQLDFLRRVKCSMVQGYIFSKPLAAEDFENWCQKHKNP